MRIKDIVAVTLDGQTYMREPHTGALINSRPVAQACQPRRIVPPMAWNRPKPLTMKAGA